VRDEERPTGQPARSPDISALLRDLGDLRLSLATDLSLAAAALEEGSPELAGAVVEGDRAQLADFERRALQHLARSSAVEVPAEPEPADPDPVPVPRRRRSLLTAVTPLLATAAAVLGVLAGVVPTGAADPEPATSPQAAMASYQELTQLTLDGAEATAVARAAERLRGELDAIVEQAASDPAAAQAALALLESETLVLDSSADRDALSEVIAEARLLVARLRAALPPTPVRTPRVPSPSAGLDDVVPAQAPAAPVLPEPSSPRPDPSPEPSAQTPPPSPEPSASSSPSPPSSGSGGVREGGPALPDAALPAD
jgi:hypothetical protein